MVVDQVAEVIKEVVASHEFHELILRKVLEKFGPKLAEVVVAELPLATAVNGLASNFTPEGLAWHYQQKLSRRPFNGEDMVSLAGQFEDLIKGGIPGERIFELLKKRGRGAQFIIDFCKSVRAACPVIVGPSAAERAADTARRIAEDEGRA